MSAIGLRLWEREGMAGLANPPNLSLIVQTLGGELPQWVAPSDIKDEQCDAEFIIVRGLPTSHKTGNVPAPILRAFSSKTRVILSSAAMGAALNGRWGFPGIDLHIEAKDGDLDLVGEALAAVLPGNSLIGVDWADLLFIAGAAHPFVGIGSAVVVEGVHSPSSIPHLQVAVSQLDGDHFGGNLALIQLVSQSDETLLTLERLDAFASQVCSLAKRRIQLLTAVPNASRSATVLFTFGHRAQSDNIK